MKNTKPFTMAIVIWALWLVVPPLPGRWIFVTIAARIAGGVLLGILSVRAERAR